MNVQYGEAADISSWMALVREMAWNFPGLEREENLAAHRDTVLKFMGKRQAVCVKEENAVTGVLLFSRNRNMICCLGVSPAHRRKGIASALLREALSELDRSRDITVSTFVADDPRGDAPRALYKRFGFREGAFLDAYGCPNQEFILPGKECHEHH